MMKMMKEKKKQQTKEAGRIFLLNLFFFLISLLSFSHIQTFPSPKLLLRLPPSKSERGGALARQNGLCVCVYGGVVMFSHAHTTGICAAATCTNPVVGLFLSFSFS